MLGIQGYISSLKSAMSGSRSETPGAGSKPSSFHHFPLLPAELRRKIWNYALPERIMEVKLCPRDGGWSYYSKPPTEKMLDSRKLPALFLVNVESRELCLEQYVLFTNHYIHPTLDILYVNWYLEHSYAWTASIEGRPLDKFKNVVISAGQNKLFPTRFGGMMECIKTLGSPNEITLGLNGSKLPHLLSDTRGYSTSTGHQVILLTWLANSAADTQRSFPQSVAEAFKLEEEHNRDLKLPQVKERMVYIYLGP